MDGQWKSMAVIRNRKKRLKESPEKRFYNLLVSFKSKSNCEKFEKKFYTEK